MQAVVVVRVATQVLKALREQAQVVCEAVFLTLVVVVVYKVLFR